MAARAFSQWQFVLVDLRNHGNSKGFDPPHSIALAAHDVRTLVRHLAVTQSRARSHAPFRVDAVIGHSLGGKVALELANQPNPVSYMYWILDSFPGVLPAEFHEYRKERKVGGRREEKQDKKQSSENSVEGSHTKRRQRKAKRGSREESGSMGTVPRVLDMVRRTRLPLPDSAESRTRLWLEAGFSKSMAQWLSQNVCQYSRAQYRGQCDKCLGE